MKNIPDHTPVMPTEVSAYLKARPGGVYLDATVGLGGHAEELLRRSGPDGLVVGLDRDAKALEKARARLSAFGERARLVHANYADLDQCVDKAIQPGGFDGVLADLGVSSLQLMDAERGFSFMREGPLDMRMDSSTGETALDYLRRVTADELLERLAAAGEERFAKRLLPALMAGRDRWRTTRELAEAVARLVPRRGKSHPATRVFLAIRMAVNRELEGLEGFLAKVPRFLKPGGRLAVITFHSTEDRIVKRFYSDVRHVMDEMLRVNKSPVIPAWGERRANPRSRSAKLRVFERRTE